MKEIIDLVSASVIFIGLLFPAFYYTVTETEEARELVKEYLSSVEKTEAHERRETSDGRLN